MPASSSYPKYLIPQPTYCHLDGWQVATGLLLRRTSEAAVLDAFGRIRPDQLSHPTEDLARHFSVNLLGNFQVADAAWVVLAGPAKAELVSSWVPGEAGHHPGSAEATLLPPGTWGYYWLAVSELHNCAFESIGETFTCRVCHAPTRSNYWHFELHFYMQTGDVYLLETKQRKKVAPKLRAWLQDYVHTNPPENAPAAVKWPETVYVSH